MPGNDNNDISFPRGTRPPSQSPLFWVSEKDRYLRQLLIKDIEAITRRHLVVYFTDCDTGAQIDQADDKYLLEVLTRCDGGDRGIDLLLETNGGFTDATEKVVSILKDQAPNLRVMVPKRAKSNGTLLALAAQNIVLGACSELGPIDPHLTLQPGQTVPAQFIVKTEGIDQIIFQVARHAILQTQKLASTLLAEGMMAGKPQQQIEDVVEKLSTRDVYHSHGSVIDHAEAVALGLSVEYLPPENDLWQRIWLLRCMYEHDSRSAGVVKIFEGAQISSSIRNPLLAK